MERSKRNRYLAERCRKNPGMIKTTDKTLHLNNPQDRYLSGSDLIATLRRLKFINVKGKPVKVK